MTFCFDLGHIKYGSRLGSFGKRVEGKIQVSKLLVHRPVMFAAEMQIVGHWKRSSEFERDV